MAQRALIIGSEIAGLSGVTRDLEIVKELLGDRGFEIRRHERATATRDAVNQALVDLAADTAADDAVVVYYSGHGGRSIDTAAPATGVERVMQFIAPYDFADSTPDDFRGITAAELSAHTAALSARTSNVTVVLDCCYSSLMARDTDLVPRGLPRAGYTDIAAHLARMGVAELARSLHANVESNPDVVRLVAAGPTQQAYEYPWQTGRNVGLFTDALRTVLTSADGAPLTWAAVARSIRRWVQPIAPNQRPEAEGPADRLLFRTDVRTLDGVLPGTAGPDGVELGCGLLAGVTVGDVYAARAVGADDSSPMLALLRVRATSAATSVATVELTRGVRELPADVEAHPVSRMARRWPVAITTTGRAGESDAASDGVRAALAASRHVDPAMAGPDPALVTVDLGPGGATVADASGPIVGPIADDADGTSLIVRNVDRIARAASLRALGSGDPGIAAAASITWGRVVGDEPEEFPAAGNTLYTGDRIWVRLRNDGVERLWFHVFSVGVSGRINRVTAEPSGLALHPGQEWVVGYRPDVGLTGGLEVSWPDGVSRSGPRPASLTVVVTDRVQDLGALEQEGVVSRGERESGLSDLSDLEGLLEQVADGGSREISASSDGVRFAVRHLDHLLVPDPRPEAEAPIFLVDERPDPSTALLARSLPAGPEAVAVRLAELVVLRNHAFRSAAVRLDTLVVTGPATAGGPPVHTAGTWRFPQVRDGDRLSFDNLLLTHGPDRDYLDVAVWLSRDSSDALDLAALIDTRLNDPAFTQAAGAVALAAPPIAIAVASIGAVATLVNLAYHALDTAVGKGIGVYRTSFLAGEGFGVGEHPTGGMRTEQGMSFRFRIDAV